MAPASLRTTAVASARATRAQLRRLFAPQVALSDTAATDSLATQWDTSGKMPESGAASLQHCREMAATTVLPSSTNSSSAASAAPLPAEQRSSSISPASVPPMFGRVPMQSFHSPCANNHWDGAAATGVSLCHVSTSRSLSTSAVVRSRSAAAGEQGPGSGDSMPAQGRGLGESEGEAPAESDAPGAGRVEAGEAVGEGISAGVIESSALRRVAPLPDDIEASAREAVGEGREAVKKSGRKGERGAGQQEKVEEVPYPHFMAAHENAEKGVAGAMEGAAGAVGKGKGVGPTVGKGSITELPLMDAIKKVKELARAKFDETVEVHIKLGVDPKRSDQTVRGSAVLPRGSGKMSRIAVFAEGAKAEEAKAAGADIVGGAELIQQIKESGGKLDFDKCIATPALMPQLTQVARILGPKGLMPNPKMGTVTMNVAEAVGTAKRGKADFRADKTGNVHCGVGKVSFPDEALRDNVAAVAAALLAAKPAGLKKTSRFSGYFTTLTLSSTMGPGIRTSIPSVASAADAYSKTGV